MNLINEEDVVNYLGSYPEFFERHAELLAAVQLSSPHGRRAVSLQERQAEMLRDKIRMLEHRIMEMIRHGNDNLALTDRLLHCARDLLQVQDKAGMPGQLTDVIQSQFAVPQVAIRLWGLAPEYAQAAYAQGVSENAKVFAASLHEPFCGVNSGFESAGWLAHPELAASLALLALRDAPGAPAFGLLVLASPDAQRFTSTMGTEFLARIGELAGAALSRLK